MGTQRVALLISKVGKRIKESITTSNPLFDSDTVLSWLNDSIDDLFNLCVEENWSKLRKTGYISTVVNQQNYDLPSDLGVLESVWWKPDTQISANALDFIPNDEAQNYESSLVASYPIGWSLLEGKLRISSPSADAKSNAIQLNYFRILPHMHTGTLSSASSTTAVLPSTATLGEIPTIDDYLNGADIYIVSGKGSGQRRTITDYVADTRSCTVSAWSTTPDSTSVYEILCFIPERYCELLVMGAVRRCEGIEDKVAFHNAEYQRLLYEFQIGIGREQIQELDYIRI